MDNHAVIHPVVGKKTPKTGPVAVMAATSADLAYLLDSLRIDRNKKKNLLVTDLWISEEGIAVAGPFIGAPHAAMVLENLIVCGAGKIIFSGWCGAVSPDISTGDILLVRRAWADEGTSVHYGHTDREIPLYTSDPLFTRIEKQFEKSGTFVITGDVWTTDAIYRETPEKIRFFQEKNVAGVEMELSALIAVSRFRGVELASVQVVSDEVSSLEWKPGFGSKVFKDARRKTAEILAETCRGLI